MGSGVGGGVGRRQADSMHVLEHRVTSRKYTAAPGAQRGPVSQCSLVRSID